MLCRPFGDLSHVWLCYVGPLVTIAILAMLLWPFGDLSGCLAMLCRPIGDLSRAWLYYVDPLVTLAVFGYVM